MGPLLLLRSLRGLGLLETLLPSSSRSLAAVQCICNSAACSTSTSKPSSGPEALRQQQQQQQDIWERKFQRRIVRRRPKGLLNPYAAATSTAAAAAAAQQLPDAQRIANTVWQSDSSSMGLGSLKQSVPQSYFNSSSSSSISNQLAAVTAFSQHPTAANHSKSSNSSSSSSSGPQQFPRWADATAVSDAAEEAAAEAAAAASIADAADVPSPAPAAGQAAARVSARPKTSALSQQQEDPPDYEVVYRGLQPRVLSYLEDLDTKLPLRPVGSNSGGDTLSVVAVHVGGEVDFKAFCKEFNFTDRMTTLKDHVLLEVGVAADCYVFVNLTSLQVSLKVGSGLSMSVSDYA
jgi:hypothetical protein